MPQFVAAAGYALSAAAATGTAAYAIGVALVEYQILIGGVGALLGGSALSQSQARKAQRKMREQYNAAQVDRMQNVVSTIGQRELVMGRVRKAGTVFAKASTGANKEKFCLAIALAGHEIDAVETVYFNDQPVTLDGSGNVTTEPYMLTRKGTAIEAFAAGPTVTLGHTPVGTVSATYTTGTGQDAVTTQLQVSVVGTTATITTDGSTPYTGDGSLTYQYEDQVSKAQVRIYLGTADQAADADLQDLFPGDWTADHRARGVAYLVCEFDYDETAFPSGIPSVSAVIRGAKLYDPRDASTAWSENPALMVRHVLTHSSFGKRASLTAAEDARIAAAANVCDTSTGYVVSGVTTTRALFTAGTVVPYGAPAKDVLDDLCQAMGGMWAYAGGQFYLRAGVYTAPVMTLTEADLAVVRRDSSGAEQQQPIVIGAHKARADKVNVITPRIWDAAQGYKQVALTPLAPAALIARDGAWLAHEIDMPTVNYSPQALHVAGIIIRDDRDSLRVTLPFKLRAYPIELFDTIALTIARYGWTAKEFIVLGRTWTHDGSIQLSLKETAAAIYQLDAAFDPQGYAENTNLPVPWDIDPPSNIVVTSGTNELLRQADGTIVPRVKVAWDTITDKSLLYGGEVEVRYRLATETAWHTVRVPAEETSVYLLGAKEGQVGYAQLRTRNSVAVSDWSAQITHQVAGKTEAPGDVTSLAATGIEHGIRISGILPSDPDLAYAEVWMASSAVADPAASATRITWGLASSYDQLGLTAADGTKYFWVRCVDNSGNLGDFVGPVSAVAGITATPGAVTGLTATAIKGGISISGTLPTDIDLSYVELWESATSTRTDGALYTSGLADEFNRMGLTSASGAKYYWVRCVNTSGAAGAFVGPVSATALDPDGRRTATLTLYQWASSTPTLFPSGTSTYTWADASFTSPGTLNSWTQSPGAGTAGQTLYACRQSYSDTLTAATSTVTWATSTAYAVGTAGTNGTNGAAGAAGNSSRIGYRTQSQSTATPSVSPNPTSGSTSFPTGWAGTITPPTAGNSLWAIDGTYVAATDQTTWSAPYLTQGITTTIQSDNFVANTSGWRLKRDTGDLEANNGTFRGSIDVNGTSGINFTNSGSTVAKMKLDASNNVLVQSQVANKTIGLLGPSAGGLYVDDFTNLGQTVLRVQPPGASGDSWLINQSGHFTVQSSGGDLRMMAGALGTGTMTFTFGAASASTTKVTGLNADRVDDYHAGNSSGQIPVSNGAVNANLIAEKLGDGSHTYKLTGGSVTGTGVATFSGSNKPGASTTGVWIQIQIDGTAYDMQVWPRA